VGSISLPGCVNPRNIDVNPPGTRLFISCQDSNAVAIVRLDNLAVNLVGVGTQPTAIDITPDGQLVYVANSASGNVTVLQEENSVVHAQVAIGGTLSGFGKFIGGPTAFQVFRVGSTPPAINYTDLWWNPNESGWGLDITQQFGVMFLTWFVYEDTGRPIWYVASNCVVKDGGNGCSGTLYRTSRPPGPLVSDTFDPSQVDVNPVGSIDVTFTDANNGVITYTVENIPGSKTITRQLF
jgi:YVTN family beta-propeller protein